MVFVVVVDVVEGVVEINLGDSQSKERSKDVGKNMVYAFGIGYLYSQEVDQFWFHFSRACSWIEQDGALLFKMLQFRVGYSNKVAALIGNLCF